MSVRGYVRKDGTYVAPHYRSAPDGNFYNNWSTKGNVNPYTGEAGTRVTPPGQSSGSVSYGGYIKQDGTYVAPYLRSAPDGDTSNDSRTTTRLSPDAGLLGTTKPTTPSSYATTAAQRNAERAAYWKERGYSFDSTYMSAYAMDQKAKDVDRAAYWKERGHTFNSAYMSAYAMDQKVKDIERAAYWKERGYNFDPAYMSAYAMDAQVRQSSQSSK